MIYQNQLIYNIPSNIPGSNVQTIQNREIPNIQPPSSQNNINHQTFEASYTKINKI